MIEDVEDPVDPHFGVLRLAQVYDSLDPDRSDLDAYVELLAELGTASVLDVGCGTGTLACLLARNGLDVPGVGVVSTQIEVTDVAPPLVSFVSRITFEADGAFYHSPSTLRFRSRADLQASLSRTATRSAMSGTPRTAPAWSWS